MSRLRIDSTSRVLPEAWTITAGDLEELCGRPVQRPPSEVLVADVEGLCRGALADGQRRGMIRRDIEHGDWHEVLGFLLGEVIVHARKYDPSRRGIEFRPYLYERLRAFSVVDACRWLYGRQGQHRVAAEAALEQCRREADDELDDGAALGDRLVAASRADETDSLDARRWVDSVADRPSAADLGGEGGGGGFGAPPGDGRSGFGARGRAAAGAGRQAHFVDCLACGWRIFLQAPNGKPGWHIPDVCPACGAELPVAA